jgi:hypothetical protein
MHQPRFFQKPASCVFVQLAGGLLGLFLSDDIFAGLNGELLSGHIADNDYCNMPVHASSSGKCKKSCHSICMTQP